MSTPAAHRTLEVAVSASLTRAVTTPTGCLVLPGSTTYGDLSYRESVGGTVRRTSMHRAVFLLTNPDLRADEVVRHKCDNPPCVNLDHLERGSGSQNLRDRYERGGSFASGVRGSDSPFAVLNDELVAIMRREVRAGRTIGEVAATYGKSRSATSNAVRGYSWRHVTEPPVPSPYRWSKRNPRRLPDEVAHRAISLVEAGRSLAQVAEVLDVSRCTAFELTHRFDAAST